MKNEKLNSINVKHVTQQYQNLMGDNRTEQKSHEIANESKMNSSRHLKLHETSTSNALEELVPTKQLPSVIIISNELVEAASSTIKPLPKNDHSKGNKQEKKPCSTRKIDMAVSKVLKSFNGRQTTKPVKVAQALPIKEIPREANNLKSEQKFAGPSLDPLPENFTLPRAQKLRISNISRQQIESQIARGKELLQKRSANDVTAQNKPKPQKRSAGQMLSSNSSQPNENIPPVFEPLRKKRISEQSGQKSGINSGNVPQASEPSRKSGAPAENIHQISEPLCKRRKKISDGNTKLMENLNTVKRGATKKKEHEETMSSKMKGSKEKLPHSRPKQASNDIQGSEQRTRTPVVNESTKQDAEAVNVVSDVAKFKILRREYIELMDSIKRPAILALDLKTILDRKIITGTKAEKAALKGRILAIGKELRSESFQGQKRKLKQMEVQLQSLKRIIKDRRNNGLL